MDVLSDVLTAVKLEGALFFNAEFSAPWCLSTARSAKISPYLCPGAGHMILFHFLTEGRAYAQVVDGPREELQAGDIVVIPHGDPHLLGNGPHAKPVDSLKTFGKALSETLAVTRFGGGGETTKFVCGFMACEPRLSEVLLAGLPQLIKVRVTDEPSGEWLKNSIQFTVGERGASNPGRGLVLAKLSEVLFVETLRRYITSLPPDHVGWLAGARDPIIGQALAYMHKDPEHQWTISGLARKVGVSRTRFVERFRHFIGESPMAYLTKWRLKLAAEILQSSEDSIAAIALTVGYASEAAFNRAFRREFNSPPARFRRDMSGANASPTRSASATARSQKQRRSH
jgi:AraC-like DNA-binding protein